MVDMVGGAAVGVGAGKVADHLTPHHPDNDVPTLLRRILAELKSPKRARIVPIRLYPGQLYTNTTIVNCDHLFISGAANDRMELRWNRATVIDWINGSTGAGIPIDLSGVQLREGTLEVVDITTPANVAWTAWLFAEDS